MHGKTSIVHQNWMNGQGITAAQQVTLQQYGDWPNMTTTMQGIELNVIKDFTKNLTGRIMYQYQHFRSNDWHYDYPADIIIGTAANVMPADMGPRSYHVNALGLMLQYKF
jgi:hypothetical protein